MSSTEDLFGPSDFYSQNKYENWAKVLYYGRVLSDCAFYNKKEDVFVFHDGRYGGVFEITFDPLNQLGELPQIKFYSGAKLPFYKDGLDINDLVGTTYLGSRALGYPEAGNEAYIMRVARRYRDPDSFVHPLLHQSLYAEKYPMTDSEKREAESGGFILNENGKKVGGYSAAYAERLGQEMLKEQKAFADWYMAEKLKISPPTELSTTREFEVAEGEQYAMFKVPGDGLIAMAVNPSSDTVGILKEKLRERLGFSVRFIWNGKELADDEVFDQESTNHSELICLVEEGVKTTPETALLLLGNASASGQGGGLSLS